jgi:transposase
MSKDDRVARIGLDCHRTFSTATARAAQGKIVWRKRLEHGDRRPLRRELGTWPKGAPVVLEGTFGWGWMSDELSAAGLEPHLASSKKVAAWRDARGLAKSNRTDADLLSELWTQEPRWWEVWLAPREVRSQREWLRYRMTLVRLQTGLKNRIHAVMHRHGIAHGESDLFGARGRRFLNLLVAPEDATLPPSARATLKGYLQLLDHVRRQIAAVTREVRRQISRTPAGERLRTLPGIDYVLAYTILAEVGRIERFRSAKHLASYSLLAPRAYDSGEDDGEAPKGRHIGHAGRRTLQWAWIEAAHGAVRKGGRFREIFDRRTDGGKRDRNRGYIAVGHELCRIAYTLWDKEMDYTDTPPPRPRRRQPGRALRRATKVTAVRSRPGTGQPDRPMVAVSTSSRLQTSL